MEVSKNISPKFKIGVVILGIVVIAGAAYVANVYPTSEQSLSGSVVPADRYRADTRPTDLTTLPLGDQTVSQFMQTDLYQRIVTDKAVAAAFSSHAFLVALDNEAFRDALAVEASRGKVSHSYVKSNDAFRGQANAAEASRAESQAADSFNELKASDAFRELLASDVFREGFGSSAFRDALASPAFRNAMKTDVMKNSDAMGISSKH